MKFHALAPTRSGGFFISPLYVKLLLTTSVMLASSSGLTDDDAEDSDEYTYETTVHGYQLRPTDETTSFAETIEVGEKNKTIETVSDVLSKSVSVQVRRLGGLGAMGTVGIRGSTSSQVPVYLDGVLLNSGGFSSVNLGDLNLDILESIEVYRGGTPVSLGLGGIGGALSLRTRRFDETATELVLSYGSWNTARLMALHGNRIGKVDALAIISIQGARGDFEYLNRNGTPLNDSDDRIQERQNNQHVAYSGLLKLDGDIGSWEWILLDDLFAKRHGVAGIDSVPTENAELRVFRNSASLQVDRTFAKKASLQLGASYLLQNADFNDTDNEIGVGHQRSVAKSDTFGGYTLLGLDLTSKHYSDLRMEAYLDRFSEKELVEATAPNPSTRARIGLGLEHAWRPWDVFRLVPAVRLQWHRSKFAGGSEPSSVTDVSARSDDSLFWSPSLGIRWEAVSGLTFRANAGRYVRPPDLAELFGDRGAVVGNPELDPEVGINADAGFSYVLENRGLLSLMRFDAAWFGSWVSDLIAYVQNSQDTIKPENVDAARILGAETGLRFLLGDLFSLHANYTYLYGINLSDKPYHRGRRLPGRPEHEAYGKVQVAQTGERWGGGAWFDADYAGRNYLDQANLKEDALARLLFGVGFRIERPREGLTLTIEVRNLFNTITVRDEDGRLRPLRDYEAFPLPGRTIFATLHWNVPKQRKRDYQ
ncbi:MAG: TonB-dependent receptor [Deltaproteobacteria bacterium]|nr:TonB-dependent receptor [Deltaproteobacteria bacterium]